MAEAKMFGLLLKPKLKREGWGAVAFLATLFLYNLAVPVVNGLVPGLLIALPLTFDLANFAGLAGLGLVNAYIMRNVQSFLGKKSQ